MDDFNAQKRELERKEEQLRQREQEVRLRELETQLYAEEPPLYKTRKHEPTETRLQRWRKQAIKIAKFVGFVLVTLVVLKIGVWLGYALLIAGIAWIGYLIFLKGE